MHQSALFFNLRIVTSRIHRKAKPMFGLSSLAFSFFSNLAMSRFNHHSNTTFCIATHYEVVMLTVDSKVINGYPQNLKIM